MNKVFKTRNSWIKIKIRTTHIIKLRLKRKKSLYLVTFRDSGYMSSLTTVTELTRSLWNDRTSIFGILNINRMGKWQSFAETVYFPWTVTLSIFGTQHKL